MSNEDRKFCLAFSCFPEIGPARFRKIKKFFGTFENAWNAKESDFVSGLGFKDALASKLQRAKIKISPEKELANMKNLGVSFITAEDDEFPALLSEVSSAPYLLFHKGDISLLGSKQIGVVGSRLPSQYGKTATERIVSGLSKSGFTITSGLAQGIDSVAHKTCLQENGKTVAVLGAGIFEASKNVYAKRFIEEISAKGGVVLSEYHPHAKATRFTFPARNRIISGLSLGVLVVEAAERSGALITARYALEEGREVFAVPGSIFSEKSIGTHNLIKQGAQLVANPADILETFNFSTDAVSEKSAPQPTFGDETEKKIYSKLSFEPLHIDKISKLCAIDSQIVSSKLSLLELSGIVKNVGGGMFIKQ